MVIRKVIVLLGALIMMFISIYQTKAYVEKNLDEIEIVVAKGDIKEDTKITSENITLKKIPQKGVHPESILLKEDILGYYTTSKIANEEPILKSRISTMEDSSSAHLLALGYNERIMAIPTDLTKSVGGIIKVGDFVDLISVLEGKGESVPSVKTFMKRIRVVDVRDSNARTLSETIENKNNKIIANNHKPVPSVVLLAVSSAQAETICLYQKMGDIVLILNPKIEKG